MTPGARLQAAIELLDEIERGGRPADSIAAAYFKSRRFIGAKDRRAVADRVYGCLRRRARLDWWIGEMWRDGGADSRTRVLADVVLMERPSEPELAELFEGAHAPSRPGLEERELLRQLSGKPLFHHQMPDWVRGEYPSWMDETFTALYGDRKAAEMGAMRDEAPLDLRVNTLKGTRDEAVAALAEDGFTATPTPLSPLGLRLPGRVALMAQRAYREGFVEVQDEGSQLVALLTEAKPGQAVADFCSGAGGKTLALAALMANKGRLVACDVHDGRMARAAERLRRAGVHNVTKHVLEAEGDRWIKRSAGTFDRVLVDAPCTGTGTWRRNPEAKWRLTPQDVEELAALQRRVLTSAARLVRPGGRLIYATCSIMPAENEDRIAEFTAADPAFSVMPVPEIWQRVIAAPCPGEAPLLRLSPAANGTDGFFVAVLTRSA